MTFVVLGILAVVVVAIGFYAVGHAVGITEQMPAQIVIDAHEAIEFCAEALTYDVTANISYDELRRLLRLHLEWIQAYHWAPEGLQSGPIVFEQFDALDYVMERIAVTDLNVTREVAAAAIQAHSDYLQVVGAIHLEDPVKVEQDLAELPLLDDSALDQLDAGAFSDGDSNGSDTGDGDLNNGFTEDG